MPSQRGVDAQVIDRTPLRPLPRQRKPPSLAKSRLCWPCPKVLASQANGSAPIHSEWSRQIAGVEAEAQAAAAQSSIVHTLLSFWLNM
jgi:hypothetical protein